ncbi:hypothetical protein RF640_14310 [Kocuria sp. CPCC 205231]|uniref:hypothetical protein n=1 Tax=Kocuria sp. CPCC 205231 TaxID=3073551 RepID=UPI0034D4D9CE
MQAMLITLNSICMVLLIVTVLTGRYKFQWGDTKLVMAALTIGAVSLGGSLIIISLM